MNINKDINTNLVYENQGKAANLRIYPNPALESITLKLWEFENSYDINISDSLGRAVAKIQNCNTNLVHFYRKGLENGLYLYQVVSGNKFFNTGKFILM